MLQHLQPSPSMIANWAIIALYLSIIMTVLRQLGRSFGPLVKQSSPKMYTWLAAAWSFLQSVTNDLFKLLHPAQIDAAPSTVVVAPEDLKP